MVKDPRAPQGAHRIIPVNLPTPVAVECDVAGSPVVVRPREAPPVGGRQSAVGSPSDPSLHSVAGIQSVWRIDDEWWRNRPVSRVYYSLLMEDGRLLTVFQDLEDSTWWEQRY